MTTCDFCIPNFEYVNSFIVEARVYKGFITILYDTLIIVPYLLHKAFR